MGYAIGLLPTDLFVFVALNMLAKQNRPKLQKVQKVKIKKKNTKIEKHNSWKSTKKKSTISIKNTKITKNKIK